MPVGGFNPDDARRIQRVVQRVESDGGKLEAALARSDMPSHQIRRFELKEDLAAGESAEAYVRVLIGTEYLTTEHTFTVSDGLLGRHHGLGKTDARDGSRGIAVQFFDGRWEVVAMDAATRCLGVITQTSPLTVNNVEGIDGVSPTADAAETLEIVDRFSWSAVVGKKVLFELNGTTGDWEAYQMEC